jgi:hypothetical protein
MRYARECFPTTTNSVYEILGHPHAGFVIPSYQRRYAWDSNELAQLVQDIANGFVSFIEGKDPNSFTYIGTMITTDGRGLLSAGECEEISTQVVEIVDGQQRASTISLICLAVHRYVQTKEIKFNAASRTDAVNSADLEIISKFLKSTREQLENVLLVTRHGNATQRFPKLIRISEDRWLANGNTDAGSPIAHLVRQQLLTKNFNGHHTNPSKYDGTNHERNRLKELLFEINSFLSSSAPNEGEDDSALGFFRIPLFEQILRSGINWEAFLGDSDFRVRAYKSEDPLAKDELEQITRLCVFTQYMLHRVALTVVNGQTENFALEVFQSLNTTGKPLNAYETFKPSVIRKIDPDKFAGSDEQGLFERVDRTFLRPKTPDQRRRLVEETIVNFAVAHDGSKIGRRLSDQHRFFRDSYPDSNFGKDETGLSEGYRYLHLLGTTAEVMYLYQSGNLQGYSRLSVIFNSDEETRICFSLLADIRHSIVLPIIALFFDRYELDRNTGTEGGNLKSTTIRGVLKAITAFSVLWRCAFGGTNGIDAIYRKVTSQLKELPEDGRTLDSLRGLLVHQFTTVRTRRGGPFQNRDAWVKQAKHTDFYALKGVGKFFLLLAHNDTLEDKRVPGTVISGASGCAPTFTYDNYVDPSLEKEHVYPQQPRAGEWPDEVLRDMRTINYIGNLILVPKEVNRVLSNGSWNRKKEIFSLLANPDLQARGDIFRELQKELRGASSEALQTAAHLTGARAISIVERWDTNLIEARGEALLRLGYTKLINWLGG